MSSPKWYDNPDRHCRDTEVDMFEVNAESRSVCEGCPVRSECLRAAMQEEAGQPKQRRFGVRGGVSPRARYKLALAAGRCEVCKTKIDKGVLCTSCEGDRISELITLSNVGRRTDWKKTCIQCGEVGKEAKLAGNVYCNACRLRKHPNYRKTTVKV